jgi:ubiquinone/menaquinone biosynthesis C-methylase UbiE
MEQAEIKDFYDDFLKSRMLNYRISGNRRIDKAVERILQFVQPDHHVLDVGCGIGITSEQVAEKLKEGHIWACDISEKNIWYARRTVDNNNIEFFVADIVSNFEKIESKVKSSIDISYMVDVIEHIPKACHKDLFRNLSDIGNPHSFIILTYPSPQYQKFLKKNEPRKVQIIDEVIEVSHLIDIAEKVDYKLIHFSMEAMGYKNQYAHCVFQKEPLLDSPNPPSFMEKIVRKAKNKIDRIFYMPRRRKKYVEDVFDGFE